MSLRAMFVSGLLVCGLQAVAMPDFDGLYNCVDKASGGSNQLVLSTMGEKLFIRGALDMGQYRDGLPCANIQDQQTIPGSDMTVSINAICDGTKLSQVVSLVQPSEKTNFTMNIAVAKTSANQVDLNITVSGQARGQAVNSAVQISCTK